MPKGLPFSYIDYLELADSFLNIYPRHWVYLTKDFESPFKSLVGSA
jgi:hypothetical protein